MNTRSSIRLLTLFSVLTLLVFTGCDSGGSDEDTGTPPELVSTEAFSIQTELFRPGANKGIETKTNFTAAAFRVWPVSIIISANLIVPAAITAAALQDTPEFVDGAWEWSTSTQADGNSLTFTLTGRPVASGVNWAMKFSSDQPILGQSYDGFELITAQTRDDGSRGSWQLFYKLDGARTNVLNADFIVTDDENKTLTFSVPAGGLENAGDSVEYSTGGDDRGFVWQQINEGQEHNISWNAVTRAGSIIATNFNGGVEGCWDSSLDDVMCSN